MLCQLSYRRLGFSWVKFNFTTNVALAIARDLDIAAWAEVAQPAATVAREKKEGST